MALMVADALITLAALFCFGIQSGLFCILGLLMKSVLVDYVTDSFRMKKRFQIITTNPEPIIDLSICIAAQRLRMSTARSITSARR